MTPVDRYPMPTLRERVMAALAAIYEERDFFSGNTDRRLAAAEMDTADVLRAVLADGDLVAALRRPSHNRDTA